MLSIVNCQRTYVLWINNGHDRREQILNQSDFNRKS